MKHAKLQSRLVRLLRPKAEQHKKNITVVGRQGSTVYEMGELIPLT